MNPQPKPDKSKIFGPGITSGRTKIKILARKFLAYRAAQREALEPVDLFCRRGDSSTRFAYFD